MLPVVDAVTRGLHRLHTGTPAIVHRDLHPNNIFIETKPLQIRLIDFGFASVLDDAPSTTTLAGIANQHYMAPEQADGHKSASIDIYALAIVTLETLTGIRPAVPHRPLAANQHERMVAQALSHGQVPTRARPVLQQALSAGPEMRQRPLALRDQFRDAMSNQARALMNIDDLARERLALTDVTPILPRNPYESEVRESVAAATRLMQKWCLSGITTATQARDQVDKYVGIADPRFSRKFRAAATEARDAGVSDLAILMVFSAARSDYRFLRD